MTLKEDLGNNIRKYRKLNKLTQEKLAELLDIEINSISSIERGKYFPSPDNLVKISKVFEIPISELFTFSSEFTNEEYYENILHNLNLVKDDNEKLRTIYSFIKSIL